MTNCDLKTLKDAKMQHCIVIDIDERIVERKVKCYRKRIVSAQSVCFCERDWIEKRAMHMSGTPLCFLKDVIVFHLHLCFSARLLFSSSLFTFRSNSLRSGGWVSYQRLLRFSLRAGSLSLLCDCLHKAVQQEADEFGCDGWWWFIRCDCHLVQCGF